MWSPVSLARLCSEPARLVADFRVSNITFQPLLAVDVLDMDAYHQMPAQVMVGELDRVSPDCK